MIRGGIRMYHGNGMVRTMRTTIDKAGRLVIPRPLRDRIGLAGGGEVELELDGAAIRIEPVGGSGLRDLLIQGGVPGGRHHEEHALQQGI